MFRWSDFRGLLPLLCVVSAFVALTVVSFMHLDQHQLGRLMTGAAAAGFVYALCCTLWNGELWLRGRPKPFTRKNEPIEYWIATTIAAIFVGVMMAIVVLI
jgi:hypothetical protein